MSDGNLIKVWDPLVRIGHWTLVAGFAVAYATEDDLMLLHSFAGYVVMAVLAIRIPWGLVGTRHARFSDFVRGPRTVIDYVKDVASFRPRRHIGHNPAGGAMIVLMIVTLILVSISGLAAQAMEDGTGLLAGQLAGGAPLWMRASGEAHEFLANFAVVLVAGHLVGVAVACLQHRENLVRAMFTGYKAADRERA